MSRKSKDPIKAIEFNCKFITLQKIFAIRDHWKKANLNPGISIDQIVVKAIDELHEREVLPFGLS